MKHNPIFGYPNLPLSEPVSDRARVEEGRKKVTFFSEQITFQIQTIKSTTKMRKKISKAVLVT